MFALLSKLKSFRTAGDDSYQASDLFAVSSVERLVDWLKISGPVFLSIFVIQLRLLSDLLKRRSSADWAHRSMIACCGYLCIRYIIYRYFLCSDKNRTERSIPDRGRSGNASAAQGPLKDYRCPQCFWTIINWAPPRPKDMQLSEEAPIFIKSGEFF